MKQAVVYRSAFVAAALTLGAAAASAQGNATLDGIANHKILFPAKSTTCPHSSWKWNGR